jgi:putative intracellular protease/amidase
LGLDVHAWLTRHHEPTGHEATVCGGAIRLEIGVER